MEKIYICKERFDGQPIDLSFYRGLSQLVFFHVDPEEVAAGLYFVFTSEGEVLDLFLNEEGLVSWRQSGAQINFSEMKSIFMNYATTLPEGTLKSNLLEEFENAKKMVDLINAVPENWIQPYKRNDLVQSLYNWLFKRAG